MKELIKVVAKKLFILSIIVNTVYSLADYGEAFALSYFGTSPLTLNKIISLTISIFVLDIIMNRDVFNGICNNFCRFVG